MREARSGLRRSFVESARARPSSSKSSTAATTPSQRTRCRRRPLSPQTLLLPRLVRSSNHRLARLAHRCSPPPGVPPPESLLPRPTCTATSPEFHLLGDWILTGRTPWRLDLDGKGEDVQQEASRRFCCYQLHPSFVVAAVE
ncbi:hypothetical protein DAI22_11g105001 [Oryza sativa Japonica Group]|nr:hypothetical protein DAI22_11g105001 [Oryza sativa Japonica Group]